MTDEARTIQQCFEGGRAARQHGNAYKDNPWGPNNTLEREAWAAGWSAEEAHQCAKDFCTGK